MNLMQRINAVRKSIKYVQKDKSVSTGDGSYRAVTHDMVTAMVREHMVTHGIISWPVLVESLSNPFEVDKDMNKAKRFRYEATYDFHFCNEEDRADEIVIRIQAHAMDNADKAPGKALSYAKKYALLKLFEIETGEDEESRVKDGFDASVFVEAIATAETLDDLKSIYAEAFSSAGEAKDKAAQKEIIVAKDKRKAEIMARDA